MNLKNNFVNTKNAMENGRWVNLYGIDFKIAYYANKDLLNFVREKQKETGIINPAEFPEKIICEMISCYIVKDWRGLKEGYKNIKYTPEMSKKLFFEKENGVYIYMDLMTEILELSADKKEFYVIDKEIVKK
jgi:hypothetical protein